MESRADDWRNSRRYHTAVSQSRAAIVKRSTDIITESQETFQATNAEGAYVKDLSTS